MAGLGRLQVASVEDVHDARVAARRLRSMLKTFRPLLDARRARLYRIDLRSFARALGGVREADVRRELLLSLGRDERSVTPAAFQRLARLLDKESITARDSLQRHLAEPGWTALCRALEGHAENDRLLARRDAGLDEMLELVGKPWRRAGRLIEREPEEAAELHELRLALKHCRYALEPVAGVAPKSAARLLRRLRDAQNALGDHRDTVLALHWVRSNERALGRSLVARLTPLLEAREDTLRRKSIRRSGRLPGSYQDWRRASRRADAARQEVKPIRPQSTAGRS